MSEKETFHAIDTPPAISEREIFAAAAALPAEERAAYLDAACAGRAEMRANIERLLAAHEADSFMQRGAARSVSPELEAQFARLKPEESGDRIGHYKLLQNIGEGGFGVVWMAEQEKPVRRRVALKIIKLGMDTKEVIARFEQERQAVAMMDHPNIAKVFDAGATQFGRPFSSWNWCAASRSRTTAIRRTCRPREGGSRSSSEAFEKEAEEEVAVEAVELVLAVLLLAAVEPVAQVVVVAVEEAFALDEIDEHQAVEHDGGIPFAVCSLADAVNELEESFAMRVEVAVERLCDTFDIEGGAGATSHGYGGEFPGFLFFERDVKNLKFLEQGIAWLLTIKLVRACGERFAGFAPDPHPRLA